MKYTCYIAKFRSLPIYNFTQQTYTWLEKGSIWSDVNQMAAAKTVNKMFFAQEAPRRTSGWKCKKLTNTLFQPIINLPPKKNSQNQLDPKGNYLSRENLQRWADLPTKGQREDDVNNCWLSYNTALSTKATTYQDHLIPLPPLYHHTHQVSSLTYTWPSTNSGFKHITIYSFTWYLDSTNLYGLILCFIALFFLFLFNILFQKLSTCICLFLATIR